MPSAVKPFIIPLALAGFAMLLAPPAFAAPPVAAAGPSGPEADYPMVLGDPFTIDGKTYTPADTLNYDAVGYAAPEGSSGEAGGAIFGAHRTLPLPSYVEVTSLASGRTILLRLTQRGPMTGALLIELSPGAWAQLGLGEGTRAPVRVRRVNPPEPERALLRTGQKAPERMETPAGLLNVLRRRLSDAGDTLLSAPPRGDASRQAAAAPLVKPAPPANPGVVLPPPPVPQPQAALATAAPAGASFATPASPKDPAPSAAPSRLAVAKPSAAAIPAPAAAHGGFAVQVATFSTEANAAKAAARLSGTVVAAGKFWRVRLGPFAERKVADSALAKARAAGYADARVLREP